MNKKMPYYIAGATGLIALVSIGSTVSLSSRNKAAKATILDLQTQIARMEAAVPDVSAEPEIIYLDSNGETNELTMLKTQLAEKEARLAALADGNGGREDRRRGDGERESWEDRIARMKEEDPEGYAKMLEERSDRQQRMRYTLAERTATFMDLDTSTMSEEELTNHEQLVAIMAQVWEMTEQFQDPEAAPDREAFREMRDLAREVQPLLEAERTVMFKQLGTELGYEGEDAAAFAAYADEIIEATSMRLPGGRGGGGGGR
ncbi:hypothetical protein [Pontiella sp.]|uniref:hypothetical protein n=1 Tax=Pontiella sp. TaxID=2837462 RepID=UPI00356451D1